LQRRDGAADAVPWKVRAGIWPGCRQELAYMACHNRKEREGDRKGESLLPWALMVANGVESRRKQLVQELSVVCGEKE